MAKSATPSGLFVRQASGLVRDVSMTNALFFNIAAFVGTAVGWAIAFYALYPEWVAFGISAYAYMAVVTGIFCYFLGMIFASLVTAMPRSGGDYVFTSRIISPFWGWIESWTLAGSSLAIIGFEIIVAIYNIQLTGILLGVAFPGSVFANAQNWIQDTNSKVIVGIIILLVIAVIGALIFAVFMNSVYMDVQGFHFGFDMVNAWGYLYWNGAGAPLNGQPPFSPVMLTAVHPQFWPLWLIVALGNITLNVLLCPVYAIFLSRIVLAWALDRQVPEWFSIVNERTNAPLRVIILAVLIGAVFYILTFINQWFPSSNIYLSLASTTFFGILLAGLTWIMPGLNAILIPYRRPDLFQLTNNTGRLLGLPRLVLSGIIWLIFIIPVYVAAFGYPVYQGLLKSGTSYLSLSNSAGVGWALIFLVVGIVIYFVMRAVNTSRGINVKMIYQELPPD